MKIFLTYDYELFFGETTGSVSKCLLEPTRKLLNLSKKEGIKMVFFVDVGYLIKMEEFAFKYPELTDELVAVKAQIRDMIDEGHDVQLHVHPHWEKSIYNGEKWVINVNGAYKLADFPIDEIERILSSYKYYLDNLIGRKTIAFRAGGWCVQPFHLLKNSFKKLGLKIDSSVFPGGKFFSPEYNFDFTDAPMKSEYSFEDDVCLENDSGSFLEYPIASWQYSPFFYWRLYIMGRLNPTKHKMWGDGSFLAQPGRKKAVLTNFTWNHVSTDGYYASQLVKIEMKFSKEGRENLVIIGHPKSMTTYSFEKLSEFVHSFKNKHQFITFEQLQ